jgi:hypothetical protein
MKKLVLGCAVFFLTAFTACNKKVDQIEVVIVVKGGGSAPKTVFQISDFKFNLYGADDFVSDQKSETNGLGYARFQIKDSAFSTGGQRTFYFFANYFVGTVKKTSVIDVTISKNDKKTESLVLN